MFTLDTYSENLESMQTIKSVMLCKLLFLRAKNKKEIQVLLTAAKN